MANQTKLDPPVHVHLDRIGDNLHAVRRRLEDTERMIQSYEFDLLRIAVSSIHVDIQSVAHNERTKHNAPKAGNVLDQPLSR